MRAKREVYGPQLAAHEADLKAHRSAEGKRRKDWERTTLAAHRKAKKAFDAKLAEVSAQWEAIAYCGDVPANVTGAKAGQWIVAVRGDDGGIVGQIINEPTSFRQASRHFGWMVCRVLDDGRAEVVV